jgi:hypothetical protein
MATASSSPAKALATAEANLELSRRRYLEKLRRNLRTAIETRDHRTAAAEYRKLVRAGGRVVASPEEEELEEEEEVKGNEGEAERGTAAVEAEILSDLFYLLVRRKSPFQAYTVLRHHRAVAAETEAKAPGGNSASSVHAGMYERLCNSFRCLDPAKHAVHDIERLVRHVVADVRDFDDEYEAKSKIYPTLISALMEQKSRKVGHFAMHLYRHMTGASGEEDEDAGAIRIDVDPSYYEHLLSMSKFNRREDLPFPEILRKVVDAGRRPDPLLAANVLEHLYPFCGKWQAEAEVALRAILDLQQPRRRKEAPPPVPSHADVDAAAAADAEHREEGVEEGEEREQASLRYAGRYVVDISTLEAIGAAAARAGNSPLCMLVWDAVDAMGYEPTKAIYEATIASFARRRLTYQNAFVVMAEMEARGYPITRALVRSVSFVMR